MSALKFHNCGAIRGLRTKGKYNDVNNWKCNNRHCRSKAANFAVAVVNPQILQSKIASKALLYVRYFKSEEFAEITNFIHSVYMKTNLWVLDIPVRFLFYCYAINSAAQFYIYMRGYNVRLWDIFF